MSLESLLLSMGIEILRKLINGEMEFEKAGKIVETRIKL